MFKASVKVFDSNFLGELLIIQFLHCL